MLYKDYDPEVLAKLQKIELEIFKDFDILVIWLDSKNVSLSNSDKIESKFFQERIMNLKYMYFLDEDYDKIYDILKPNGEIYFDVLSKKCWLYSQSNFPKLDNNTILSKTDNSSISVPLIPLGTSI